MVLLPQVFAEPLCTCLFVYQRTNELSLFLPRVPTSSHLCPDLLLGRCSLTRVPTSPLNSLLNCLTHFGSTLCSTCVQHLNSLTPCLTGQSSPRRHLNRQRPDQTAGHQATPAGDDSQLWLADWMTSGSASGPRLPSSPTLTACPKWLLDPGAVCAWLRWQRSHASVT